MSAADSDFQRLQSSVMAQYESVRGLARTAIPPSLHPSNQTLLQRLFMRHEPHAQPLITALCVCMCVGAYAMSMFGVTVFFVK